MNESVACGNCKVPGKLPDGRVVMTDRPMELVGQYPVNGVNTWGYHCMGCNGKAHLQQVFDPGTGKAMGNPQTGGPAYRQVQLTGSPDEFRPHPIGPNEQVKIEAAYTIGGTSSAKRVPADPIPLPQPAYTLSPDQQGAVLHPSHPMHPANLRRRMLGQR
jgi:hypothetical protein